MQLILYIFGIERVTRFYPNAINTLACHSCINPFTQEKGGEKLLYTRWNGQLRKNGKGISFHQTIKDHNRVVKNIFLKDIFIKFSRWLTCIKLIP